MKVLLQLLVIWAALSLLYLLVNWRDIYDDWRAAREERRYIRECQAEDEIRQT